MKIENGVLMKIQEGDVKNGSVSIPEGVKEIGAYAFYGCDSLESVSIPEGVKEIGAYAFGLCNNLESVSIPEGVEKIGAHAFGLCNNLESVSIPEGVEKIGAYAFYGCDSLESVNIPEGVEKIGAHAFYGCDSLESVSIPEGVKEIGAYAFSGCTSLESVSIPEGVKEIGERAFSVCASLESVSIPEGVKEIGAWAFGLCNNLESVSIGKKTYPVEYIDGYTMLETEQAHRIGNTDILRGRIFLGMEQGRLETKGTYVARENGMYAHGKTVKEAVDDLRFKQAQDRGIEQYQCLKLDTILPIDEAVTAYRVITGACRQGTKAFLDSLEEKKECYSVGEMLALTKGQYGHEVFRNFIEGASA